MSIESIAAIGASGVVNATADVSRQGSGAFDALVNSVAAINKEMHVNESAVQALALGQTDNLHQVVMNMESTKLSFDLMMQVRNKVLEAYQELMRMRV